MDKENADQLAHKWAQANRRDDHGLPLESARFEHAAVNAVTRQATDFVPETAIRIVVHREGEQPVIAALEADDMRLTLVGAEPRNKDDEAVGHWICVRLDPKVAVAEARSKWHRDYGASWRTTHWEFDVHPKIAPLKFVSEWCLPNDPPDEERFAQALCEALGVELPEADEQPFPQYT